MPDLGPPETALDNRVSVLVLRHPQEQREARATAAPLVAALRRARLATGLSWPNLGRALGRRADPARWGVLYLGSVRPAALAAALPARPEIIVLGRDAMPVGDAEAILKALEGIVLIDGTWSQAKTLWWRNPWLLRLHRLVLNPPGPARLGRLRREPRREALSTIEAASLALRHFEGGPAVADGLLAVLDELMTAQERPAQGAHSA